MHACTYTHAHAYALARTHTYTPTTQKRNTHLRSNVYAQAGKRTHTPLCPLPYFAHTGHRRNFMNDYDVKEIIGKGSFGDVYLAYKRGEHPRKAYVIKK